MHAYVKWTMHTMLLFPCLKETVITAQWHCLKLKPFIIFEHCSNSTKSLKYLWFCWVSECQRLPDAFKNICTYNYHFDEMRRVNFGRALKTWYVIKTSFFFLGSEQCFINIVWPCWVSQCNLVFTFLIYHKFKGELK